MPAIMLTIADAVVSVINAAAFIPYPYAPALVAYRTYVPLNDIKLLGEPTVIDCPVVPTDITNTLLARSPRTTNDYMIDVGVQTRISTSANTTAQINAACDPLVFTVQEIIDLFLGKPLAGIANSGCIEAKVNVLFIPKMLDEEKLFRSSLTLTFRLGR